MPQIPHHRRKNGRIGRISFWKKTGVYGTYFRFCGKSRRSSFKTLDGARVHLETEFVKLDRDQLNSQTLYPTRYGLRVYHELEERLRERTNGTSLHDTVDFYLMNHEHQKLKPRLVEDCIESFMASQETRNVSPGHLKSLKKHFKQFRVRFKGYIHEVFAEPLLKWLNETYPGDKTRKNVRGDLVTLFKFSQKVLKALPLGNTAPQDVPAPITDEQSEEEVEIYSPEEFERLLLGAVKYDITLVPAIAIGGFGGLRPAEIHGENARYEPIHWDAFKWNPPFPTPTRKKGFKSLGTLDVKNQKVRNIRARHLPIYAVLNAWLEPFKDFWRGGFGGWGTHTTTGCVVWSPSSTRRPTARRNFWRSFSTDSGMGMRAIGSGT